MAKEYIEREAVLQHLSCNPGIRFVHVADTDGTWLNARDTIRQIRSVPAADVVEVVRPNEAVLEEFENDYKDFKKIKTHLAQIIVGGKVEEPCYSILWWDKESKEYNIGYSSYCLDYVRKWLELVFEVVDTVDVVEVKHGRWISDDRDVLFSCSECGTQISTSWDCEDLAWNYCPNCGAKMDGGAKDGLQ